MTDTTKQDPHAELMRLAEYLETVKSPYVQRAAYELRRLHTENSDLRDQLEAVGAGGVGAMIPKLAPAVVGPVVPDGWKLVPVEPDMKMVEAGKDAELFQPSCRSALVVYRAMLAAAPQPQQIAEPASQDTERLDWLETQGVSYGFEDSHEGNRWTIEGPFRTLRTAIDECMSDATKEQS